MGTVNYTSGTVSFPVFPIGTILLSNPRSLSTPYAFPLMCHCVVSLGLGWLWVQTERPKAKGMAKMAAKLEVHVPLIVLLFILSKYPSE